MIATPVPFSCTSRGARCVTVNVPGPAGDPGQNGTDGLNGVNAYTLLTDSFIMPVAGGLVTVDVLDTSWMVPTVNYGFPTQINGQVLVVQYAGSMLVESIVDSTHVVLANLGYATNAPNGVAIPAGARVGVGGLEGASGSGGGSGLVVGYGPPSGVPVGFNQWLDVSLGGDGTPNNYLWAWNPFIPAWVPLIIGP